mgnify:CR=1 FL=1
MAEAIEINFPTESDKNPKIDSELKNQILGFNVKESMDQDKNEESCPEEYTIDNYYKEDDLGRSVLEMKYLAPGEKNPWELWKRQAKALASVEKTPELQDKWEAAFFEALEKSNNQIVARIQFKKDGKPILDEEGYQEYLYEMNIDNFVQLEGEDDLSGF